MRPVSRFPTPTDRPVLRAVQPLAKVGTDEDWQPEVLRLSRVNDDREVQLVNRVHARIAAAIGRNTENVSPDAIRGILAEQFPIALEEERLTLNRTDRLRLQDAVLAEIVGYGPIQDLVLDDTVSEIMVNGPRQVWIEREGKLFLTDVAFADADHILRIIQRIVAPLGRRCDESSPMVDARLMDGSRINVAIRPIAIDGPLVSIRKFAKRALNMDALVRGGALSATMAQVLGEAVRARLSIVISGGTGSGKTTFLNALSRHISSKERLITIEDAAELQLQQPHVGRLETRPPNMEGRGEIRQRELVKNALRMRPDRIIVGEVRGEEAFDMLQAMTTGHEGSMTTVHANGPRDAISRLEQMVGMAGFPMSEGSIRSQIASAIRIIVQLQRFADGKRRVTSISEITGMDGTVIQVQEIFRFQRNPQGGGEYRATGLRPTFIEALLENGAELPSHAFHPGSPQ